MTTTLVTKKRSYAGTMRRLRRLLVAHEMYEFRGSNDPEIVPHIEDLWEKCMKDFSEHIRELHKALDNSGTPSI